MFGQSLLSAFGSAACTTDTDQLFATDVQTTSVATYQFNNATTSIPSNTYPGTPSSITYAAGKFGNAAVFNGTSSRIQVGLNIGVTQVSLSFWVKGTTNGSKNQRIIDSSSSNYSGMCQCLLNTSGKLQIARGNNSNVEASVTGNINIGDNSWHHCAVVLNGNSVKTYIDGVSDLNTSTSVALGNDSAFFIGNQEAGTNGLSGSIDQLRIFNTVLPQSAVTALYNETTTTATYDYVEYEGANPNSIAYYKMSDATDQLGNYNGTASNVNFNTVGKFGFAGAFNGSSSVVNLNSAILPTDIFSVSLWINVTTLQDNKWIFSQYTAGVSARFVFNYNAGGDLQLTIGGSGNFFTSTGAISANTWHNIVVVKNASSGWKIYVDGSNVGSWNSTANIMTSNNTALGGRIDGATTNTILGSLDQIRIYDSALSAANVTTLYEEIECPAVAVTNAFNTVLWTGDGTSSNAITGVGFEPDLVWIKSRSAAYSHRLFDSVRGATKRIMSNSTDAEAIASDELTAFGSNGFTLSNGVGVNQSSATYVAWNWKAGGAAVSNTDGTITSQVSANVDAGFSIVKWTGGSATGLNVGHGLGVAPSFIILKPTDRTADWYIYHKNLASNQSLRFDTTAANTDLSFPNVNSLNFNSNWTASNWNFIAYCFAEVDGYSRIGSYVGTGATGNVQYVGFEPAFVMMKAYSTTSDWFIVDNKRNANNPRNSNLRPNNSNAESNAASGLDFLSNGFEFTGAAFNDSGVSWIFMAIA